MEMILNTIRMIEFDQSSEYSFGDNQSLKERVAVGFIHPEDFKILNLKEGINIKLTSKYGEVIIRAKQNKKIPQGLINVPVSIWVNQVTGVENGELIFKNLDVNIQSTEEKVENLSTILSKIKGE